MPVVVVATALLPPLLLVLVLVLPLVLVVLLEMPVADEEAVVVVDGGLARAVFLFDFFVSEGIIGLPEEEVRREEEEPLATSFFSFSFCCCCRNRSRRWRAWRPTSALVQACR